jgi:hypothetical protein
MVLALVLAVAVGLLVAVTMRQYGRSTAESTIAVLSSYGVMILLSAVVNRLSA